MARYDAAYDIQQPTVQNAFTAYWDSFIGERGAMNKQKLTAYYMPTAGFPVMPQVIPSPVHTKALRPTQGA